MPTKEELRNLQALPLELKVAKTQARIKEWVEHYGEDKVYVSFSGGKDSTVLLHLCRELYPNIPAVFVNTGLEFPEIQSFVKSFDNVTILYPKMSFSEVIKTKGYPIISKAVAHIIAIARSSPNGATAQNFVYTDHPTSKYNVYRYRQLLETDFIISDQCCYVMKKNPVRKYGRESKRFPLVATMAYESVTREKAWLKDGCNSFNIEHPVSSPMSFWEESDVLQYIKQNNLKIASCYGNIIQDTTTCSLCTSGCDRTGCIFCGFGAHIEKESRFKRLKETHPKQYNYCIGGGELDTDGIWKPNKNGLGLGHVIDELNELYSKNDRPFIEY